MLGMRVQHIALFLLIGCGGQDLDGLYFVQPDAGGGSGGAVGGRPNVVGSGGAGTGASGGAGRSAPDASSGGVAGGPVGGDGGVATGGSVAGAGGVADGGAGGQAGMAGQGGNSGQGGASGMSGQGGSGQGGTGGQAGQGGVGGMAGQGGQPPIGRKIACRVDICDADTEICCAASIDAKTEDASTCWPKDQPCPMDPSEPRLMARLECSGDASCDDNEHCFQQTETCPFGCLMFPSALCRIGVYPAPQLCSGPKPLPQQPMHSDCVTFNTSCKIQYPSFTTSFWKYGICE